MERVTRFDLASGELAERRRTPQGGLIAKANLTRTGVFTYRMADGSSRRELRHPDEVFHPDALATYAGAPLTIDHPGRVTPDNWKAVTVGHVGPGARPEGRFVAGEVYVQDGRAIDQVESGSAREVSCGYTCDIDPIPGEHEGEPYDVAQRNIRINHVAMGPPGWGRMGPDTRLKLDSAEAVSGESEQAESGRYVRADNDVEEIAPMGMTNEEKAALEKAEKAAKDAADALDKARQDAKDAKTEGEKLAAQTRADAAEIAKLKAENEALRLQSERKKSDDESLDSQLRADAALEKRVEEMIQLRADARMVFATEQDPDAKNWKSAGKTPDQIRLEIIGNLEPKLRLDGVKAIPDASARSAALASVYETVINHKRSTDQARAEAQAAASAERREDGSGGASGGDDDQPFDAAKARKDMVDRMKNGWKKDRRPSGAAKA